MGTNAHNESRNAGGCKLTVLVNWPGGADFPSPPGMMSRYAARMNFADLTAPQLRTLAPEIPVVIPIAAVEQHGGHLPVFTDSLLLGEIIRRVAPSYASSVVFAPLLWLGHSDHHLDLGGTLSASSRSYLDLLRDMVDNLIQSGFRRIALLNGHGGNDTPGRQALFEVRQTYRHRRDLLLALGTYWALGESPRTTDPTLVQDQMGHACEWETSMILQIAPSLVGEYRSLPDVPFGRAFDPGYRAWITTDRSGPGHIGSPRAASIEKGERLFAHFTGHVREWIERLVRWDGQSWEG